MLNILDTDLLVVLVAFPPLFPLLSPGSGHYSYGDDEEWYFRTYQGDYLLLIPACRTTVHAPRKGFIPFAVLLLFYFKLNSHSPVDSSEEQLLNSLETSGTFI